MRERIIAVSHAVQAGRVGLVAACRRCRTCWARRCLPAVPNVHVDDSWTAPKPESLRKDHPRCVGLPRVLGAGACHRFGQARIVAAEKLQTEDSLSNMK
jgi:hypothetical protein